MKKISKLFNIKKIVKEINLCTNWEEKIDYLIYLSKNLPLNKKKIRKKKYILYGCYNSIWLKIKNNKKKININADSNTLIVKGILFIILSIFNNKKKKYIINIKLIDFFKKINLFKYINITKQIIIQKVDLYIKNKINKNKI